MRDVRARELLPTVLVTLVSIVQALALEAVWTQARESAHLFAGGLDAWVGWLQVAAVLQGIVVVWLLYTGMVMRFSWVPSTRDSVAPFVLGGLELVVIELMRPGLLPYWFYVLAAVFAVSSWVSASMLTAGMRDPANAQVVEAFREPGGLESLVTLAFVASIAGLGGVVHRLGPGGWTALVCVALANAILAGQGWIIHRYWRRWVGLAAGESAG